jgi:hypothetical protein
LTAPFDIIVEGRTHGLDRAQMIEQLGAWSEAGATWWLESLWGIDRDEVVKRLDLAMSAEGATQKRRILIHRQQPLQKPWRESPHALAVG